MVPINEDNVGLSREDSVRLMRIVDRFEQAWQEGQDALPSADDKIVSVHFSAFSRAGEKWIHTIASKNGLTPNPGPSAP
jgi:hypothetical protein